MSERSGSTTDVYDQLCACLRDPSPAPEAVSTDVLSTARLHRVHLVLANRLQLASLAGELRDAAVVEALRANELGAVLAGMAAAGVRPIVLKGAALARTHYPRPELRPRDDTDLMIPASARALISPTLIALGYSRMSEVDGEVAFGQFHFHKHDRHGLFHALDIHWKVSNVRMFADVLTYEELARDAMAVPSLGPTAWSASPAHALLLACIHRVAHHGDSNHLLWLLDVQLLARSMTACDRQSFTELASERQVRAVCARSLELAQAAFGGVDAGWLAVLSAASAVHEPSAAFIGGALRQVDILRADLTATSQWRQRLQLLREHVFPAASYMRERYPRWPAALLPIAYVHRMVRGAPRWFRR